MARWRSTTRQAATLRQRRCDHDIAGRSPLSHSMKRLAVSLVALLAMLAFFATLSAAAQGVAETGRPIIDPAIDETA